MCSVSFLPGVNGFVLAMNRDEQKSRALGMPPQRRKTAHRTSLYPAEPGGGTWIGVNDAGLTLALVNWNTRSQRDPALCISRGSVIPRLLACAGNRQAEAALKNMALAKLNPFRLIMIARAGRSVTEWRWDGKKLKGIAHGWARAHWFSSAHDEVGANLARGPVAAKAMPGNAADLRALHRGHLPRRGAYSICMHRNNAGTVSYTEIAVTGHQARMHYAPGAPCTTPLGSARLLPLG